MVLAQSPEPYDVPEAYEVYSTLLQSEWPWLNREFNLTIVEETNPREVCVTATGESKATVGPAISDYIRINQKHWLLRRTFVIDKPYDLVSKYAFKSWVEFSAVGFNADKTIAVVFAGYSSGASGGGAFHVLQKHGNTWSPLKFRRNSLRLGFLRCGLVALLTVAVLLLAQSPEAYNVPEAYEVYAAILPGEWPWTVNHEATLAIIEETKLYNMCLEPAGKSKSLLGQVIADYIRVNQKPSLLQRKFEINKPYELVSRSGRGYPSLTELSAVGFNADKTIAVVYAGYHCGSPCGGGRFHVLQKHDNQWLPLEWDGKTCMWAS